MTRKTTQPAATAQATAGMETESPIERALMLPNGARFYRCALQVNPHGYAEQFRGQPNALDADAYVEEVMARCVALEIEAIALTDHGSVAEVDRFRAAGARHGVVVFPGFELKSTEGVDVLCIYDRDTTKDRLGRFLGELGATDTNPNSGPCKCSFRQILAGVHDQGGVTIAAHITNNNGLFTTLKGQPCIEAWRDRDLLAVQIPGTIDELPGDKPWKQIIRNRNPDYRRPHPAGEDLAVAVINSCDVKEPSDLEKPGASCEIKMSSLSLEGLRQAFLDPDSRIRLAGDVSWEDHAEVVAMAWEGGFLDNARIHFSKNLNALVGGRGTGKSTVLESLRYALAIEPVGDDACKQHESVVRTVLKNGTKVTVDVCSYYPARTQYRIERTVPNPPVVRDQNGQVLSLRPRDVMPRIQIFGQHEIAELANNKAKLTRLIERFVPPDLQLPGRLDATRRELEQSRERILGLKTELQRVDERLAALPAIEETLKKYQDAGIEGRLQEQALIVREERVLKTAVDRTQPAREALGDLRHLAAIDLAFLSEKSLEALPAKALLEPLATALRELSAEMAAVAKGMTEALARADAAIGAVRTGWEGRRTAAQAEYERILRDLQRDKVNGGEFIRLREQIEELRPLAERRAQLMRDSAEEVQRRHTLATEWEDVKGAEYRTLEAAARKVTAALRGRVRVQVVHGGDRSALIELLREELTGTVAQTVRALETDDALSLPELAALCRGTTQDFVDRYHVPRAQAERITGAGDELAMRVEALRLAPTTQARLNIAPEGQPEDWKTLDALSSGQKATAVLLLLLLDSDAPLIVDQPEDDLDNRFITDGIVPTMRRAKRKRQFIFTTHNANIPVLGDAELIVGLKTQSDDGRVRGEMPLEQMGSIDKPSVRVLVEELLEGGKDAFEMRRRKYHF